MSESLSARAPFMEMLRTRWEATGSLICVGLDPEIERIPSASGEGYCLTDGADGLVQGQNAETERRLFAFIQAIVDATADAVCAFKPNSAFFEQYGEAGIRALRRTIADIHARHPGIPVILDAKRGDIGSTSAAYARFVFDYLDADAVTLHPYLGRDAIQPFLDYAGRGALILCRTSNPGSGEFQNVTVAAATGTAEPLYQHVARTVAGAWNKNSNCGLVVGATWPEELGVVRGIVGDMPILVPGVGAQGGDAPATIRLGRDSQGYGLVISQSRSVLYASDGPDFAEAARREVDRMASLIAEARATAKRE